MIEKILIFLSSSFFLYNDVHDDGFNRVLRHLIFEISILF